MLTLAQKRLKPALFPAPLPRSVHAEKADTQAPKLATEEIIIHDEYQTFEGMEEGQREEQGRDTMTPNPFQRDPAGADDIFSWSPDLLESHEEYYGFNHSDEQVLFVPNQSPSSNPFLTDRASGSMVVDQAEGVPFTYPHFVEEYDGDSDHLAKPPERRDGLTGTLLKTWPLSPASMISMERLRLAGDRSGVGLPLKRWVGDGLELDHDEGLFSTVYHLDSDEDDGFKHSTALNWLARPYEDHLIEVHDDTEQDDRADLATITPDPDTNDAEGHFKEPWLHDFTEGEEPIDAGSPSEQNEAGTGIFGSFPATPIMRASPEEEVYRWELEEDVVQVVPIPVEDEEVFILAPTLFDFD
jgi:hypothetical protein